MDQSRTSKILSSKSLRSKIFDRILRLESDRYFAQLLFLYGCLLMLPTFWENPETRPAWSSVLRSRSCLPVPARKCLQAGCSEWVKGITLLRARSWRCSRVVSYPDSYHTMQRDKNVGKTSRMQSAVWLPSAFQLHVRTMLSGGCG